MKKFLIIIVAFAYLATSIGATLHMHYCMGKLAGWEIGYNQSHARAKCGNTKTGRVTNGCCRDELQVIKNNTDQKITESVNQASQLVATVIPSSFIKFSSADIFVIAKEKPVINAPPGRSGIAIYIYDCSFLI